MNKNILLKIASFTCNLSVIIYAISFILLTVIFIHIQIQPNQYTSFEYNLKSDNFSIERTVVSQSGNEPLDDLDKADLFKLSNLNTTSIYFIYVRLSLILLFTYLVTKEFQIIIESVKQIKTFRTENIRSFKRMSKYLLFIFLLLGYRYASFTAASSNYEGASSELQISFTCLALMLFALIMSEIFREGNKLSEDNQLTI
jgi:hypothetical protein